MSQKDKSDEVAMIDKIKYRSWNKNMAVYVPKLNVNPAFKKYFANFMIIVTLLLPLIPLYKKFRKFCNKEEFEETSRSFLVVQTIISLLWLANGFIMSSAVGILTSCVAIIDLILLYFLSCRCKKDNTDLN